MSAVSLNKAERVGWFCLGRKAVSGAERTELSNNIDMRSVRFLSGNKRVVGHHCQGTLAGTAWEVMFYLFLSNHQQY